MCSLRAASRNVHHVGVDFWPGRSMRASGSSPASTASARARSWYGSDRILTSLVTQDYSNGGMMGVARKRGYHRLDGQRGVIRTHGPLLPRQVGTTRLPYTLSIGLPDRTRT